ncbi:MAG: 2,3-bisphosphoglycerate-independent phosphoglycerate mutase [Planctomycetes bacterium]|nr:2,3-bisphosphoglycerate-independent phosphoglycerate mutase [Planctomycetota bacterium]
MIRPAVLVIRDGWGVAPAGPGNAVNLARTPVLDRLLGEAPWALLACSGEAVGLPRGVMGNSEVGHMNFGAGRLVRMDVTRIDRAIADGSFASIPVLCDAMDRARQGALHLVGLCSDGQVHSAMGHVRALLELARSRGVARVWLHAITDGRDTAPDSSPRYLSEIEGWCDSLGVGRVATVSGRYFAMDRDRRWDRVGRAYDAMVHGRGETARSAVEVLRVSHAAGVTDEFVEPRVLVDEGGAPLGPVHGGDVVLSFNFRADRMRQLAHALTDARFEGFDRGGAPRPRLVCMTRYDEALDLPVAFAPQTFRRTFAEVVSGAGLRQLRIAETEKYAHVTFFFSCGREEPWAGEERVLVPSPRVATYDQSPAMSAVEVTDVLVDRVRRSAQEVVIVNYANADMVGHTGSIPAAVAACEAVDGCIGRVLEAAAGAGAAVLVTADHGNAEQMIDPVTGGPHTAHTTHPVHVILVDPSRPGARLAPGGRLLDVAPTLLDLLGVERPLEMEGRSLRVGTGE